MHYIFRVEFTKFKYNTLYKHDGWQNGHMSSTYHFSSPIVLHMFWILFKRQVGDAHTASMRG